MTHKITVYQYDDLTNERVKYTKQEQVGKFEVEAWCIGGKYGILAFFTYNNYFYIAAGDDGHWWAIYYCHKDWIREVKKVFQRMLKEI